MTLAKSLLGIAVLVAVLSIPGPATAQTCVSDSDCVKGLTCQASAGAVTPTPACPVGADCPKTVPLPAPSMTCQPAPCQADADCGQGMVCHSQTSTLCSGGTAVAVKCDPNTVCDPAPPATAPVCTTTTTSQCIYKWQLPCNADANCGDGFACQPTTMGMCSGSGSTSSGSASSSSGSGGESGSGGLALPPSSPAPDGGTTTMCTTVTSYPGSCQPKVSVCTADSDCPSTWKCVASAVPTTASTGPVPADSGATPTLTPIITSTTTATATSVSFCQSPASYSPRTVGLTGNGTGTSQTTDTAPSTGDAGATTKGSATPPTVAQPSGATSTDTQTTAMATGGGCSLGAGALTRTPAIVLGLLGAFTTLRLRRRRR